MQTHAMRSCDQHMHAASTLNTDCHDLRQLVVTEGRGLLPELLAARCSRGSSSPSPSSSSEYCHPALKRAYSG